MISDNGFVMEAGKDYEPSMVTAFIRLNGATVGCVANRSEMETEDGKKESLEAVLSGKGCDKAAAFVNFCDAFNIPVLTLVNVKGYRADICSEKVIAKAAGRLTYAYANAACQGDGYRKGRPGKRRPDYGKQEPGNRYCVRLDGRFHRHDGRKGSGEDYVRQGDRGGRGRGGPDQ